VRVDLEWCFAMGESEVQALAATRSPLAQLSFKGCGALVDAAMFPLAAVTSLGAVDLTWCSQVAEPSAFTLSPASIQTPHTQMLAPLIHGTHACAQLHMSCGTHSRPSLRCVGA
jgi:hypothetical protein